MTNVFSLHCKKLCKWKCRAHVLYGLSTIVTKVGVLLLKQHSKNPNNQIFYMTQICMFSSLAPKLSWSLLCSVSNSWLSVLVFSSTYYCCTVEDFIWLSQYCVWAVLNNVMDNLFFNFSLVCINFSILCLYCPLSLELSTDLVLSRPLADSFAVGRRQEPPLHPRLNELLVVSQGICYPAGLTIRTVIIGDLCHCYALASADGTNISIT
jgi:hypothetical protein